MTDELIEQVARAIHAAHMIEKGPLAAWSWEEAAKAYYNGFAQAAIAAMQQHIEAQREDAAQAERAAVVAWLDEHHDGELTSRIYLADAIDAGEHQPKEITDATD